MISGRSRQVNPDEGEEDQLKMCRLQMGLGLQMQARSRLELVNTVERLRDSCQ